MSLRVVDDEFAPIMACLLCGHELPLALYREGTNIGVCKACRDLAAPNRGPCSPERDCGCWHRATWEAATLTTEWPSPQEDSDE